MRSQKERNRLRWIRMLMVCSLVLLCVFTFSWLAELRRKEKARLEKDLSTVLEQTHSRLTDSTIRFRLVQPVLDKIYEVRASGNRTTIMMRDTLRVNLPRDVVRPEGDGDVLVKRKTTVRKTPFRMTSSDTVVAQGDIVLHSQSIPKEVYDRGIRLLLQAPDSLDGRLNIGSFRIDTGMLIRGFRSALARTPYNFPVVYVPDVSRNSGSIFLSQPEVRNASAVLQVSGFNGYLFRSILPEMLVSVILLLVTGIAFRLSFTTLRAQMRLAAMRNDFISNMSHELKTPVSTVKVALEALQDPGVLDQRDTVEDYLRMASLETARLELLINQSLQTSLLEEGSIRLQTEPTDLHTLLQQLTATLRPRFRAAGGALMTTVAPGNFVVAADRLQVQGVVVNILDNALKYAGSSPDVSVHLDASAQQVVVSIADHGPGIPPVFRSRIFDKFFRVPRGNEHSVKGYGLGLSYAAQVMHRHGGKIALTETPGGGCTFLLHFPKPAA